MAVLWQKQTSHKLYEVRTAGSSRRLYTNGILHSQHNPNSLMTGSVWDLLTLGGFLVPEGNLKRVLLLGVAGGATLHQIRTLFAPSDIIGVELNPVHISIGKRFFFLDQAPFHLIQGDALAWVSEYRGPSFDLIIDDMFCDKDGEPSRVARANKEWVDQIKGLLSPQGAMVLNFAEDKNFKQSAPVQSPMGFRSRFRLTTGNCENVVGLFGRRPLSSREFRSRIRLYPDLDSRKASCKLKYNLRSLK